MFNGIAKYSGPPLRSLGHTSANNSNEVSPDDKRSNKNNNSNISNKKKKEPPPKQQQQKPPQESLQSDVAAKHAKETSNHVLESIRYWDVTLPPVKKYMVAGTLVPSVKNALSGFSMGTFNKKRRITIELYKPSKSPSSPSRDGGGDGGLHHHERKIFGKLLKGVSSLELEGERPTLNDQDIVIFRILKSRRLDATSDDDSESTSSSTYNGDLVSRTIAAVSLMGDNEDIHDGMNIVWKERYRARLQNMEILTSHGRTVDMKLGAGDDTVVRDFYFDNNHDAHTFVAVFQELRQLQREAGLRLALAYGSKTARSSGMTDLPSPSRLVSTPEEPENDDDDDDDDNLRLLVEIVSATNLPIADVFSSDPYVCVRDGQKEWHKTDLISTSLNPVWTLSTLSFFLIETTLAEFFEAGNYLEFIVKDYDSISDDDVLGTTLVPKTELLNGNGSRHEYELTPHTGKNRVTTYDGRKSFLALRYRVATEHDVKFMKTFARNRIKNRSGVLDTLGFASPVYGVYADQSFLGPKVHRNPSLQRNKRQSNDGKSIEYRVKPFPDPSRPEKETKWLTKRELEREAMKPSTQWIEAGSASVGKIYVEVIGCDDIPNLDMSITGRDKSDPFVCIVHEDCIVNTDVINDCLSPRWMPWTQRAFIFNMMHPSSQLYVAVFDHDQAVPGTSPVHDQVGRVVINVTNYVPDTVVTARFHLYDSDEPSRKKTGTLILRIRYECHSERQILLSELRLRTQYHVSTKHKSDFHCAYYATANDRNHTSLSLQNLTKYIDELKQYLGCLDEITDGLLTVLLWRGHFPVTLRLPFSGNKSYTMKLPLHSMVAFGWGVILTLDFEKIFSFICFCFAWILLATMEHRNTHPNPWKHTRSYLSLLRVLIFNKSFEQITIEPNENMEQIIEYETNQNERERLRKEAIEHTRIEKEAREKRFQEQQKKQEKQNLDIATKAAGGFTELALAPFKQVLLPIQMSLYRICIILRAVSSIVLWDDSVAAFWIVTVALTASFLLAWIPWGFIIRWSFRIFVWVILGPWMKLVDIFFVHKLQNMTAEERKAKIDEDYQRRYEMLLGQSYILKLMAEYSMKIQDIYQYMFGQYLMRVPIFKEQRYHSVPLSSCSARPYNAKDAPPINITRHVDGQFLSGDMVPTRAKDEAKQEKKKDQTKNTASKQHSTPKEGGGVSNNNDDDITLTISEGGTVETVPLLKGDVVGDSEAMYGAV